MVTKMEPPVHHEGDLEKYRSRSDSFGVSSSPFLTIAAQNLVRACEASVPLSERRVTGASELNEVTTHIPEKYSRSHVPSDGPFWGFHQILLP